MRAEYLIVILGVAGLVGLGLALAVALLPGCGVRLGPLGDLDFCLSRAAAGVSPELEAELERGAALQERVRGLERRLAGLPACSQPPPPSPEPVTEPEPEPDPDVLDAERWDEQDTALLEGCWSLASDYSIVNKETGVATGVDTWEMCFDAEGRGDQRLVYEDGRECTGSVTAAFAEDGQLEVNDDANVECSNGGYIYRRVMTCELEPSGEAACRSSQPEIGSGGTEVRITRRVSH